jgi:hypothetical protein
VVCLAIGGLRFWWVDEREYAGENQFNWTIRTLLGHDELDHDDAYGSNTGDTFPVTLAADDIQEAKELIAEYRSLLNTQPFKVKIYFGFLT